MTADSIKTLCVALGGAKPNQPTDNGAAPPPLETITADTLAQAVTQRVNDEQFDALQIVVNASDLTTAYNPMDLSVLTKDALNPSATVSVHVLQDSSAAADSSSNSSLQSIHTSFLLAGLVGTLERREADGSRVLTAAKKYSAQESVGLRAAPIRVSIQQEDDLLIDEDNLLSDASNLLAPPPAMSEAALKNGDDCSGRKACDDCTCGRADTEQQQAQVMKEQPIKSSACGKCNLGDAFRCASCPYLGKPAFKAGEEHLVLELQDDF